MRTPLKEGTSIRVPGKVLYQIIGEPIGEGGGSILYPVQKCLPDGNGAYTKSPILYALKECFPLSEKFCFSRTDTGEIQPEKEDAKAWRYLERAKEMQLAENAVTGEIYHTGFRLTPILEAFQEVEISQDGGASFHKARNSIAIMESLSEKGCSLKHYLKERGHLPVGQVFRIAEQVLYAVREVHGAGYLHLDIQDGNIFLKGVLEDGSGMVSLMDFGSSRKLAADGFCDKITDGVLYSTPGFSAPEMRVGNDGSLRLSAAADIYSIGYLMLYLLTGRRFSANELSMNKMGRYIPRFSIRKTKCPKHLVDWMQSILAKALASCPEERYADTEEMLREVTDFLAMLAPYRNPLSAAEYDAFICYKHGALDTPAAKCLQNALEWYGRGGLPGKRPIRRVFLDEGELASCADFGACIREALKKSRWLVIICSKATKESPWVKKEIEAFLEYHDASHILAVLIEGEPEQVFPEALLKICLDGNRLLAADARAGKKRQVLRKIKGDVRLKIAAPILQTTFDALKQRRKLYQIRRISAAACACLLVLSCFLGYAAVKSRQIASQAMQLAKEHKEALKGQALYLSEQAKQSYERHDTAAALEQALRAYDLLAEDGLSLPGLVRLMAEAMGVYALPADAEKNMAAMGLFPLEQEGGFGEYFLDWDGKRLFTADNGHVYIWDTDSRQQIQAVAAPWTMEQFEESFLVGEESRYLFVLRDQICCYDFDRDAEAWRCQFGEPIEGIALSGDQSMAAVVTGQKLYLLDVEKGEVLQQSVLPGAGKLEVKDTPVAISPDKNSIAFMQAGEAAGVSEAVLYNVEEGKFTVVSSEEAGDFYEFSLRRLFFAQDGQLYILRGLGMNTVYINQVVQYYSEKKTLTLSRYDPLQKRIVWKADRSYRALDEKIIFLELAEDGRGEILLAYGAECGIFDSRTGKCLDSCGMDAPIIEAWREEGRTAFVLENGDLLYREDGADRLVGYAYFPEELSGCQKRGDTYYAKSGTDIIQYQQGAYDRRYERCEGLPKDLPALFQEKEASSGDGQYLARIAGDGVVLEDREGHAENIQIADGPPLSLYWIQDTGKLLIGFSDKAALYDAGTGTLSETEPFGHSTFSLAGWQQIDASSVLYVGDTYSYVLEFGGDSLGVLCSLRDVAAYDPLENAFYFSSEDYDMDRLDEGLFGTGPEYGKIARYRTEEIVEMARERVSRIF